MSKKTLIIDYAVMLLLAISVLLMLCLGTQKHLCCDGGYWWHTMLMFLGLLTIKLLHNLIMVCQIKESE